MMLQLKISRTKKRLSDRSWSLRIVAIALISLVVILAFAIRATSVSFAYGYVSAEIPILPLPFEDPAYHTFDEVGNAKINKYTPVIILTKDKFFFGDVEAFSAKFSGIRNKFYIAHREGVPDLGKLINTMQKWSYHRMTSKNIDNRGIVVFMPTGEIPMPIVIQVVAGLKKSPLFKRVVLASGMR